MEFLPPSHLTVHIWITIISFAMKLVMALVMSRQPLHALSCFVLAKCLGEGPLVVLRRSTRLFSSFSHLFTNRRLDLLLNCTSPATDRLQSWPTTGYEITQWDGNTPAFTSVWDDVVSVAVESPWDWILSTDLLLRQAFSESGKTQASIFPMTLCGWNAEEGNRKSRTVA